MRILHKLPLLLMLFWLAGSAQANDALSAELQGLTTRISSNFEGFLNGLDQWSNGSMSDDQAFLRIPPMSERLASDFNRLSQIAVQLAPYANAAAGETQLLQNLQALGSQGAQGFAQWNWLFAELKKAKEQGDSATASQLIQQYYASLLNGTLTYAQQLAALSQNQAVGQSASVYAPASSQPYQTGGGYATNTPSQAELLQMQQDMQSRQQYYQSMSNMNNMMHDTNMSIINNMGSSGTTDYYENGAYIGSW